MMTRAGADILVTGTFSVFAPIFPFPNANIGSPNISPNFNIIFPPIFAYSTAFLPVEPFNFTT